MGTVATVVTLMCLSWLVARLWREHTLVAIGSIFFWPLLFYPLAAHWGDRKRDIRRPFIFFLVSLGVSLWAASHAVPVH